MHDHKVVLSVSGVINQLSSFSLLSGWLASQCLSTLPCFLWIWCFFGRRNSSVLGTFQHRMP